MKKFLLKTFVFTVVVFVLASGLDWLVCRGLLGMEDYRFQDYRAMLDGGMDNDILILGNSRGKSHFDPYVIDSLCHLNSFNIGIGGYSLNVQLMKYQLYLEHNKKPHVIIHNMDYMTLPLFGDIRNQHDSEQFFPLVYDKEMRRELRTMGYGLLELNIPLYRLFGYQMAIKNGLLEALHLKHYVSRPSYKGFLPENGRWNGSELEKMEPSLVRMPQAGKDLLESYLARCRADSIRVVLVNSPLYAGAQKKLVGYDKARAYFEQVAERFGCLYLDYTDTPMCQDTSNFCVSVHLNSRMAKQFTRELMEDLESYGLFAE